MIQIDKKVTIDELEGQYTTLDRPGQIDLIIPDSIESSDIGIIPALIQFVSTWVRRENAGKLQLNLKDTPDSIEDFIKQPYAFPIVIMSWEKGIINAATQEDLKPLLKPYNLKMHQDMQSLNSLKGQKLILTCFDHLHPQKGLLNCFYNDDMTISSESTVSFLLFPKISQVLSFNKDAASKSIGSAMEDLISIIYELIKNTDDWATTDENNQPLSPNVRGLFLNFIKKKKSSFANRYKHHDGFKDYFNTIEANNQDEVYLFEISVFDSGVGFVNRRIGSKEGNSATGKRQMEVIKECLVKNVTSAKGDSKEGKGFGLDRILQTIDNKGLLWIRTGNVSLYRNLKKDRYIPTKDLDKISLYDWKTHSPNEGNSLGHVEGSVVTIIYPIPYK